MAIGPDSAAAISGPSWVQEAFVGSVANPAAPTRLRKSKLERPQDSWSANPTFPLATIQGSVEEGLKASIRDAIGTLNSLLAENDVYAQLKKIFGEVDDAGSIARSMRDLADAFAQLASGPGQSAAAIVQAATTFSERLKTTTRQIQALRGKADHELGATVDKANAILGQIADLNTKITLETAIGASTKDIGAERDAALSSLSGALDFSSFSRDDGTVSVFTKAGTPLVNGAAVRLGHKPVDQIDPRMTLAGGELSGITANGIDISGQISAGTLHALLQTRDGTLPNVQNQLDTLAQTLQSQVNQVSNRATASVGACPSYLSGRAFGDPGQHRITLSGGDTVVSLLTGENRTLASTSMVTLMKQYLNDHGLPTANPWPISQIASALNAWLVKQGGANAKGSAVIDANGRLSIALPKGAAATLSFCDQRSMVLVSSLSAEPQKPLGLQGALTFTDTVGNLISTSQASPPLTIVPADSLSTIATKLAALVGLSVDLVADGPASRLRIGSAVASDLAVEPDIGRGNVVAGLGLVAAPDQPTEDVIVNSLATHRGSHFTSAPHASSTAGLGVAGPLSVLDQDGALVGLLAVDPHWCLDELAAQLNTVAGEAGISASVAPVGNQFALRISAPLGQQLELGAPPGAYCTRLFDRTPLAAGSLSIAMDGVTLGSIAIKPGSPVESVVDAINAPTGSFATRGIHASVLISGDRCSLQIAAGSRPLAFEGSAIGSGAGQLTFRLNPRDALGLAPPPAQVVSGFANFLGLNDVFIADPTEAFDGKAPTGIFTSTATPGTARALTLSPVLRNDPSRVANAAVARQMCDALSRPINFAGAGGLARGSFSLGDYAERIVATVSAGTKHNRNQMIYQQALLTGLHKQQGGMSGIDMNDTLANLTTYQQAYQDSSQVMSSMPQLIRCLGPSVH